MNPEPDESDSPTGPVLFPRNRKDLARLFLVMEAHGPRLGIPFDAEEVFRRHAQLEARIRRADVRRFWKAFAIVFSMMAGIGITIVISTRSAGFVGWRLGLGLPGCAIFAAACGYIYILTFGGFPSDDDGPGPGHRPHPEPLSPRDGASKPQPSVPVHH